MLPNILRRRTSLLLAVACLAGCSSVGTLTSGKSPYEVRQAQGTHAAIVIVKAPSRLKTTEQGLDIVGARLMKTGDDYTYPLKAVFEESFAAASSGVLYDPQDPEVPAIGVEINVTKAYLQCSEVSNEPNAAQFHVLLDAKVRDERGNPRGSFTAEHTATSSFDGKTTPQAVWEACHEAGRAIVEQVAGSVRAPTAARPKYTYTVDLKLIDLTGTVRAARNAVCEAETDLRSLADTLLAEVLSASGVGGGSPRIAVLGVVEANQRARDGGHGDQVRSYVETALTQQGGVKVVDRTQLEGLFSERRLEDVVNDPSVLKDTKIEGVDYILAGSVSVAGRN